MNVTFATRTEYLLDGVVYGLVLTAKRVSAADIDVVGAFDGGAGLHLQIPTPKGTHKSRERDDHGGKAPLPITPRIGSFRQGRRTPFHQKVQGGAVCGFCGNSLSNLSYRTSHDCR